MTDEIVGDFALDRHGVVEAFVPVDEFFDGYAEIGTARTERDQRRFEFRYLLDAHGARRTSAIARLENYWQANFVDEGAHLAKR